MSAVVGGLLAVALLCAGAGSAMWRSRHRPGTGALVALMAGLAVWNAAYAAELASSTLAAKLWWAKLAYIGVVSVPLAVFAFALDYRSHGKPVPRRRLALLGGVPGLMLIGVWTNEAHGLIWRDTAIETHDGWNLLVVTHGPGFYVGMVHAYLLLAAAAVLLVAGLFALRRYYRGEWALVVAAFGVPLVGNAFYVFDVLPGPRLDYTNLGFVVSGLVLTMGCTRGRLLEVMPVARGFVVDHMDDAMLLVNPSGKIVDCNPAARDLLRCPLAEAVGADAADTVAGWDQVDAASTGSALVETDEGAAWRCYEVKVHSVPAVDGSVGRLVLFHDVTAREQLQTHLREWALSDPLTGLPNRRLFLDRLSHALARAARTGELVAVLFCDLDDFKAVNDTYGHDCGDEVLLCAAHRLTAGVRSADTVARLGGDEFAVLLEDISSSHEAEEVARRLWRRLTEPVDLAGRTVTTSASIGIAVSQGDHATRELLRAADQAMYTAKSDPAIGVAVAPNAPTTQD